MRIRSRLSLLHFIAALTLATALIPPAQAHELEGIDHAHLSGGIVQIVEPIPGGLSASAVRQDHAEKGVAPNTSQPSGLASLLIQAGLIFSAIVLMVVALRAGAISRRRQYKQTTDVSSHPSLPLPPG